MANVENIKMVWELVAGVVRRDSVLSWRGVALSHNTLRGAAGGSILNAELLLKMGYIK